MEEKKERTFAYTLAKVIDNESLSQVTGGAAQWTHSETVRASVGPGADVVYDQTVDW